MRDRPMGTAPMIDAVAGMIDEYGWAMVSGMLRLYQHNPWVVAFALSDASEGIYSSIEAFAKQALEEGRLLDVPQGAKPFFDAEGYAKKHLLTGPERRFDCLFDGTQYRFVDRGMFADSLSIEEATDVLMDFRSHSNAELSESLLADLPLPAHLIGNGERLKAMDYVELTAWLHARDADIDLSSHNLHRDLNDCLGVNLGALRGPDWLTQPEQLLDRTNPDVHGLLAEQYGPAAANVTYALVGSGGSWLYALAECYHGTYDDADDLIAGVRKLYKEHGSDAFVYASADAAERSLADIGELPDILSRVSDYSATSYPARCPAPHTPLDVFPVVVFNQAKLQRSTPEQHMLAAEKVLAGLQSKHRSSGIDHGR